MHLGDVGMVDVITEAVLCWIRTDFLCCYKTAIKHKRIGDRNSCSSHWVDMNWQT